MDITIKGNPGTGNRFSETHVDHADNFFNNVEKVENNHATTIVITLNVNISLNGETLVRLCTTLARRLPIAFRKFFRSHFDGDGNVSVPVCQLSGTPSDIANALHCLRRELGDDASTDVQYRSRPNHFERKHLTLLEAEKLAKYESGL